MSPDLLVNLLVQVPALGVVVYLVIHFLAYVEKMRTEDRVFVSELVSDYKDTLKKCDATIDKNTKAVQTFNDSVSSRNIACPMMNPGKHNNTLKNDGK